jgi:hypothetical protein
MSNILEGFPWKRFGEDNCDMFFCPNILDPNFLLCNMFCRKLNLIEMCFILDCITRFFEILMALVLSQNIIMGSSYSTCISFKVCFIHSTLVQHVVAAIYSASGVDKDIEYRFLLNQYTTHSPKYKVDPIVLLLSSMLPTQSASVWEIRDRSFPFEYHNPNSYVPFRYLNILFISITCDSFGVALNLATYPTACITSGQ